MTYSVYTTPLSILKSIYPGKLQGYKFCIKYAIGTNIF
jgi:hypothetical protein